MEGGVSEGFTSNTVHYKTSTRNQKPKHQKRNPETVDYETHTCKAALLRTMDE